MNCPLDNSAPLTKRSRGYLPHWEREGGFYFVTFRLADSLPAEVLDRLAHRRAAVDAARRSGRKLVPIESVLAHELSTSKIEAYLDSGCGECILRRPECAEIVAESLRLFDGKRYEQKAWCVMPNHVHALFRAFEGYSLTNIVRTWKTFTGRRINRILERSGPVWQREYYDHLIRGEGELDRAVDYVRDNPVRAGLVGWRWMYVKDGLLGSADRQIGGSCVSHP